MRVGFVVDDQPITPPHNLGKRHVYLGAALPSPTVAHHEGERVVTQIKIRFGLNLKLLPPRIIYFREVPSQPVVTAVLGATYGSEQGMELNLPIAQRDRSFYVPRAECRVKTAMKLYIPLGHGVQSRPRTAPNYHCRVSSQRVPGGVVHALPADLRKALIASTTALDAWKDITPLARNEFICWVEDAKQVTTRERRIRRTREELEGGQRRPCCWPGCKHRERTGR